MKPVNLPLTLALLLVALIALSGHPEFHVAEAFQLPDVDAQENRFLALGEFGRELGADTHMRLQLGALPPLADAGSTLWLTVPGRMLPADTLTALQDWVARGGRLVLAPLTPALWEDDPLLTALGLQLLRQDPEWISEQLGEPAQRPLIWKTGFLYETGDGHAVRATFGFDRGIEPQLADSDEGDALFCDPVGCHAWRLTLGAGAVIALADARVFSNGALQHHDHPAIARMLLASRPGSRLDIIYGEQVPSLYALAWQHARLALLVLPVAVLLWILAASQRFGPLLATPQPARRRLAEHVAAAGQLLARHGRRRELWQATYDDFRRTLHRRHPQAHGMNDEALAELIARHAGADLQRVRAALAPPTTDLDDATLAHRVRRLDSLRRLL